MNNIFYYIRICFFSISIFSVISCSSQGNKFSYKKIPSNYFQVDKSKTQKNEATSGIQPYDLTNSLPKDYSKDGSVDYTSLLQNGIDKHMHVMLPNFLVLINKKGLILKNNSTIIFQPKSKLTMKSNNSESYQLLRLHNVNNCTIFYPVLEGDRERHFGKSGEWGMGISIMGSSNIKIIRPVVTNCWGDGIYIGTKGKVSKNITIDRPFLDNNRRNGISITSGDSIVIESPVIANTNGTLPACGIDIEPNNNNEELKRIYINNPITFNNNRYGISIYLRAFRGPLEKHISISINNPIDDGAIAGFIIDKSNGNENQSRLKGTILINNPRWINNLKKVSGVLDDYYSPKVIIKER